MNNKILYTNNGSLEKQVRSKKVIPYIVYPTDVYRKNKWYFSLYYNIIFKILDLEYKDGRLESAYIVSDDCNYSMICTDLDSNEDYSISRDRRSIYKMDIINHQESFTGAEIVYWFFMNDIDIFNEKYSEFWKYVDRYSKDRVVDRQRYFLRAKLLGGKYVDCKLIKDLRVKNTSMDIVFHNYTNEYMGLLKEKDMNRIRELRKKNHL